MKRAAKDGRNLPTFLASACVSCSFNFLSDFYEDCTGCFNLIEISSLVSLSSGKAFVMSLLVSVIELIL